MVFSGEDTSADDHDRGGRQAVHRLCRLLQVTLNAICADLQMSRYTDDDNNNNNLFITLRVHTFITLFVAGLAGSSTREGKGINTIIIIAEMAVFNAAGYLIEERRRWPVITASPR